MAAALAQPTVTSPVFDHVDVHKSCKALETIANVFNDYCLTLESLVTLQKRLAKAMRDASSVKGTNELTVNALSTVANLFDSLSEVDSKFVKLADRECESASNELKKWFKKLAKEEKGHDERIAAANAKIKQAGQIYERKAKKRDRDAAEEHVRYVAVLNSTGPEMAQEKQNHAVSVSQRQTAVLYSISAGLSRVADSEWIRACECIRRFAPLAGRIGEYRAFLEGGWTNERPYTLRDYNAENPVNSQEGREGMVNSEAVPIEGVACTPPRYEAEIPVTPHSRGGAMDNAVESNRKPDGPQNVSSAQPNAPPSSFDRVSASVALADLPRPVPPFHSSDKMDSVRSIETLSSFPVPPNYFPVLRTSQPSPSSSNNTSSRDMVPEGNISVADASRLGAEISQRQIGDTTIGAKTSHRDATPDLTDDSSIGLSPPLNQSPPATPKDTTQFRNLVVASASKEARRPDLVDDFQNHEQVEQRKEDFLPHTLQVGSQVQKSERDSGSFSRAPNAVASLRDKWDRITTTSPPPINRELEFPRITNRVSDLATRYTPIDVLPSSAPRGERNSPTSGKRDVLSSLHHKTSASPITADGYRSILTDSTSRENEVNVNFEASGDRPTKSQLSFMQKKQMAELEEGNIRLQMEALRQKEREIELRSIELERQRLLFAEAHGPARPEAPYRIQQRSFSTTNLALPRAPPQQTGLSQSHSFAEQESRPLSHHSDTAHVRRPHATVQQYSDEPQNLVKQEHAPFCGCYDCSASRYAQQSKSPDPPPQTQPQSPPSPTNSRQDRPKGWMRRLSMPVVGNAFSSESKKSAQGPSNTVNGKNGPGMLGSSEYGRLSAKPSFERDSTGGISNVPQASRSRKLSFNRR